MAFAYGRLAPHPEHTHPRVKLAGHLTAASAPPAVVDYASKVTDWPMYLNDRIGDCTCAGVGHMIQAWTAYAGTEATLSDNDVLGLYEAIAGYNPATGANDNGANEQDVLQYLATTGVAGHKIAAFAQVDPSNPDEMKQALSIFGSLYLGIVVPDSMQEQFAAGEPIDYVPGSGIDGGHCVVVQKWDEDYLYIVTWGKLVKMTWAFWAQYGEECWAIVTQDFIEKSGESPSGLNLQGLIQEFRVLNLAVPAITDPSPVPVVEGLFERIINWLRKYV